jgi:hypothetical protein
MLSKTTSTVYALYISFAVSSLFDYYIHGVRVFDLIAGLFAGYWVVFVLKKHLTWTRAIYLCIISIYFLYGMLNENLPKSAVGSLLIAIFLTASGVKITALKSQPQGIVVFLTLFHAALLISQLLASVIFDTVLNYHAYADLEARLEGAIFRPAGLFLEPAIFSLFIFLNALLLEEKSKYFELVHWVSITSMTLSLSLWGGAFALILTIRLILLTTHRPLNFMLLLVFGYILTSLANISTEILDWFTRRTSDLSSDNSYHDRFLLIFNFFDESTPVILFGKGLGVNFEYFGGSGFVFIIANFGMVGFFLLFFATYIMLNRRGLLPLFALLSAAPIFNYFFVWIWLILYSSRKYENS